MDDLISRQAAIQWVKANCNPYGKPTLDYESGIRVMEHLKRMSSAQPEILACGEGELNVPGTNVGDLISRQAAIDALGNGALANYQAAGHNNGLVKAIDVIKGLPSAQPETSRIERRLHGKTSEEQYEFLYWLLLKFGLTYTDSRLAVIEWLRGEKEDG